MPGEFRVLFVCTGNTCRSPMAAGVLRGLAERRGRPGLRSILTGSAGTFAAPGHPATAEAVRACAEQGIDLSRHRSRPLSREILAGSDLILVMEEAHRREVLSLDPQAASRVHLLGEFAGVEGDPEVADPIGGSLDDYRRILGRLSGLIDRVWQKVMDRMQGS